MLGHGGVTVKEALAFFAPYFVRAGFAVPAIGYRTVGSSEGGPRGVDQPERQVEDFHLRRAGLADITPTPAYESVAAMTQ